MSEYWFISAPAEKTCEETWKAMQKLINQHNKSEIYKFQIPNLKVGTLDQLMGLSDDLCKLDTYVGQVAHHVTRFLGEIVEDKEKLCDDLTVCEKNISTYLTEFKWDAAKYPVKQTLKSISDSISKEASRINEHLNTKLTAYNNLKNSLKDIEKKKSGSLLTRDLADIVRKEHFVLNSEHLTTLLVVVRRGLYKNWYSSYETLTKMVVPRSTSLIFEDGENGLFTVTLFKTVTDEFRYKAVKKDFVVREFSYDEEELVATEREIKTLRFDKITQLGQIKRWLRVNFSECFSAWIHVKALRVFVESVLRYGLPVNFQAMIIHPEKKTMKRLRNTLNEHYAHLDFSYLQHGSFNNYGVVIPGLDLGDNEYYPYVYFKIDIDMSPEKIRG